jgi:hypothetical protein
MKKTMKKNIIFILLLVTALISCKKDKPFLYGSQDNIYLNYPVKDTLSYSFALYPTKLVDTIWVPVIIAGTRQHVDRKFQLSVLPDSTTAVADLDYEQLKPYYIMPADSGTTHVPVIIKSTDAALSAKSVILTVAISGGQDFATGLGESIRTKKILFSNELVQPNWWPDWQGELGNFSKVKYQLFLLSSGTVDLVVTTGNPWAFEGIPRALFYIGNFQAFLADPIDWIAENPSRGYALSPRNDGTGDYDLYNVDNPTKKIRLAYIAQTNSYVFVDENGNQVTTS